MHYFERSIIIKCHQEEVFLFHTDVKNLLKISPKHLDISVKRCDPIGVGQEVHLIVKHFKLIPTEMHMKFVDFEYPSLLTDTQLKGPFKSMIQKRVFEDIGDGYTRMTDYFQYELPLGVLGLCAHVLFVESMIKFMFIFRQNSTKKLLEST